jgi:ABC-type multidrug transport system fused ATPase/permease subunit
MKEKSKKFFNKAMREKVTPGQFFKVQWKILKELYGKYRKETTAILILSVLAFGSKFIELKFLEHITDGVSGYLNETVSFQEIVRKTVIFLILLLFVLLVQNAYNRLSPKYESKIIFEVEKKINDKLSDVTYEYYESNEFYEKINLARQAGSQYPNAVYGVTQLIRILVMLVVYTVLLSKIHLLYVLVIFVSIAAGAVDVVEDGFDQSE